MRCPRRLFRHGRQGGKGSLFVEPADGAAAANPVHVKFGLRGMEIRPAGDMSEGSGHHHLLIDTSPLSKGEGVPSSERSLHFGKGQTETDDPAAG